MARRMFSPKIVCSDAFLDMPTSSRELYFQLGMEADDDGFVNPKRIMRMVGASEDDLKVLVGKRFVLPFQSGVVVIKHWKINNLIKTDRYHETVYFEEKKMLETKLNGSYTEVRNPNGTTLEPQVRLGKVRLGKDTNTSDVPSQDIIIIIDSFKEINPAYGKWYKNTTQRSSIQRMLEVHGKERLLQVIRLLPQSNVIPYIPVITSPFKLEERWADLEAGLVKKKNELRAKQPNVIM